MGIKTEDFILKKDLDGVKIFLEGQQAFDVTRNFKIVSPSSSLSPSYVTYGNKSELRAGCFMQPIGIISINGTPERIYEQDILDFKTKKAGSEYRNCGVLVYIKEAFGWKLKTLDSGEIFNIEECEIMNNLGSLYEHKAFAGCSMEIIYKLLGKEIPGIKEYAKLDEEIPFKTPTRAKKQEKQPEGDAVDVYVDIKKHEDGSVSWGYRLEYKGNIKSDTRAFKKSIDHKEYYIVASTIIALSKLKRPAEIRLYTTMQSFADVVNKKQLKTWAETAWINKESGKPEDNMATLKELKGHIDRLGGKISAVVVENISLCG